MSDYIQNMFGGQPGNPFQIPAPTMQEILFRTLASSLPPPGRLQVPNTVGGRIFGTGARLVGGLADVMGTELGRQRLDPLQRQLALAQAGIEAARGARVTEPGLPERLPGYEGIPPETARGLETAYGGEASSVPTLPATAETTRNPRSFAEALRVASPEAARSIQAGQIAAPKAFESLFPEPKYTAVGEGGTAEITPEGSRIVVPGVPSRATQRAEQQDLARAIFYKLVAEGVNSGKYKSRQDALVGVLNDHAELGPFLPIELQSRAEREPTAAAPATVKASVEAIKQTGQVPPGVAAAIGTSDPSLALKIIEDIKKTEKQERLDERTAMAQVVSQALVEREKQRRLSIPVEPRQFSNYYNKEGVAAISDPRFQDFENATAANLTKEGFRYIPETRLPRVNANRQAMVYLDRIERDGLALFKGVSKGGNLGNAIRLAGNRILGDENVRVFESLVVGSLPTLAVSENMTPGRVGTQVLERVERPQLPNLSDTEKSFKGKIDAIRERLRNNLSILWGEPASSQEQTGSGIPVLPGSSTNPAQGNKLKLPSGAMVLPSGATVTVE